MRIRFLTLVLLLSSSLVAAGDVRTIDQTWHDSARDRDVPVRIYLPDSATTEKPAEIVLFSHGLGGSRAGYSYLGEAWSAHGYVAIMLQHPGSDETVWKGQAGGVAKLKAAANADNYVARVKDVSFAIDYLTEISRKPEHELAGKINLDRIAMAGHSFGAHTTLAIAGQQAVIGNRTLSLADKRVKCAIAMSPAAPDKGDPAKAFAAMIMPVFHMTGTNDQSPIRPVDPKTRTVPYEKTSATDQYLVVYQDGDHRMFAGGGSMARLYKKSVCDSTIAFLDAYLRKDEKAKSWLRKDFADSVKQTARFEFK